MKTLAAYLAEYIETEMVRQDGMSAYPVDNLKEWIERGIEAYQSTENCIVNTFGGSCPECDTPMTLGQDVLYDVDANDIEFAIYQCNECGYLTWG
jgi:hypothetical protein